MASVPTPAPHRGYRPASGCGETRWAASRSGLAGNFLRNHPWRLRPAPQGMKIGSCRLGVVHVGRYHHRAPPWVPPRIGVRGDEVGGKSIGAGWGYFLRNHPWRLRPAPQGMKIGSCRLGVVHVGRYHNRAPPWVPPRIGVRGDEVGGKSIGAGWGYFLRNHPCWLRPAPQGMKIGSCRLGVVHVGRYHNRAPPWVPDQVRQVGRDWPGYFRTNFPCRLSPAPPLMKMCPAGLGGLTYRACPPRRPTVGTGSSPASRGGVPSPGPSPQPSPTGRGGIRIGCRGTSCAPPWVPGFPGTTGLVAGLFSEESPMAVEAGAPRYDNGFRRLGVVHVGRYHHRAPPWVPVQVRQVGRDWRAIFVPIFHAG